MMGERQRGAFRTNAAPPLARSVGGRLSHVPLYEVNEAPHLTAGQVQRHVARVLGGCACSLIWDGIWLFSSEVSRTGVPFSQGLK